MPFHYDPDGGELSRSELPPVSLAEIPILVPHIADILAHAKRSGLKNIYYSFDIKKENFQLLNYLIGELARKLPPEVSFYEIDGKKVFDLRGPAGGIVHSFTCYLVA